MDTVLTFPSPDVRYPLSLELDGDRLFGTCITIHDQLQYLRQEEGHPGFELFFTGTSGATFATALAAVNRGTEDSMDLAFCQVAKNADPGAHHRCLVEATHTVSEKRGFPRIFIDDFTASGETFRRTVSHVENASERDAFQIGNFKMFDGVIVLSGEVRSDIKNKVSFIIRPDDY